jgi:uncharacterized protein involved in type VI secretion and phage assembly
MNLNSVDTNITVGGSPCDFKTMHLHQRMAGHHIFEIEINYRHHDKSVWAETVDKIFREMLSKPVGIVMKHVTSGESNEFVGVVTDIKAVGVDGDQGTVVLKGGSPTILLDRDPAMDSFMDYTLLSVVAETIGKTGVPVSLVNKPKSQRIIPYLARYRESSWAFLSRVLYSFGEWFFYDGKKLIVGNPMSAGSKRVSYDMELLEVCSAAGINDLDTTYYDHNPTDNYYYEESSGSVSASYTMKGAKQSSDPFYPTPAKLPVGREVLNEGDMTEVVRTKESRQYVRMAEFTAKSNTCAVRIGEIATAVIPANLKPEVKMLDLGSFRVLEVHHYAEMSGTNRYHNTFRGMAAQAETLPDDHIVIPQAMAEPAIVVDNADPKNKGRVKVRFTWQDKPYTTNWIQVQTPDAGSSGAVPKNRGFFFIPEIGDQVLVGFLHADPSRPYVAGSLYHRDITKGAEPDNNVKTIITRSGHTIKLDDSKGSEKIQVYDIKGNIVEIDTDENNITIFANNDITVTAVETMTLNAKNLNINVTEDMNTSVGGKKTINVAGDISVAGTNITEEYRGSSKVEIIGKHRQTSNESVLLTEGDTVLKAGGKALVQGAHDARVSKG